MNDKVNLLPHWCITDLNPAIYDIESSTAIEQTAKVYAKIQELVNAYNDFVDIINLKVKDQDKVIADAVEYMKTNIEQTTESYVRELINSEQIDYELVTEYNPATEGLIYKLKLK